MQLLRGIGEAFPGRGGFVSIGNFDGVHSGHSRIVASLVSAARVEGVPAVVLTFDPHPTRLLRPEQSAPLLSTMEDRAGWLEELGVDVMVAFPTTPELLRLEPAEFFGRVVIDQLNARGLVEGPGFFFGRERRGNLDVLASLCRDAEIGLDVVEPAMHEGELVSSSRIRKLLCRGDVISAGELLGRAYSVRGRVVAGEGRGRELGVPTANLSEIVTLVPGGGVYVGVVEIDGRPQPAAVHVGGNPTFGEVEQKVEVHLLAFDGDLYGQELTVKFLQPVRETQVFESVDLLRSQLAADIEAVWSYVETHPADGSGTGEVGHPEVS